MKFKLHACFAKESLIFEAESFDEARNHILENFDLTKEWSIKQLTDECGKELKYSNTEWALSVYLWKAQEGKAYKELKHCYKKGWYQTKEEALSERAKHIEKARERMEEIYPKIKSIKEEAELKIKALKKQYNFEIEVEYDEYDGWESEEFIKVIESGYAYFKKI